MIISCTLKNITFLKNYDFNVSVTSAIPVDESADNQDLLLSATKLYIVIGCIAALVFIAIIQAGCTIYKAVRRPSSHHKVRINIEICNGISCIYQTFYSYFAHLFVLKIIILLNNFNQSICDFSSTVNENIK